MLKLKPPFLFEQKRGNGLESPSVYVLFYWLMNKAVSASGLAE